MSVSINIPFEELLKAIKNLRSDEKQQISELLHEEFILSNEHLNEAILRKKAFENGEIETESWVDIKKRLLS